MSWPSMDKRCVFLAVCAVALAGSLCAASCGTSLPGGATQTALGEDGGEDVREGGNGSPEVPLDAQAVLDYLTGPRFQVMGVSLSMGEKQAEGLSVQVEDGHVWVFETAEAQDTQDDTLETRLKEALLGCFGDRGGETGGIGSGWTRALCALGSSAAALFDGRLTETRACILAEHLRCGTLDAVGDGDTADGPLAGKTEDEKAAEGHQVHIPSSAATVCVHWVTAGAPGGENGKAEANQGTGAQATGTGNEASAPASDEASSGNGKPDGTGSAAARPSAADGSAAPGGTPSPPAASPSTPGSIDVVERPSSDTPSSGGTSSDPSPAEPSQRTWVVDKPAWDEQVWVSRQEWVADNVWVVDSAAWDEQVTVREGYYETVRTTSHYRFDADGYIAYTEDDLMAHVKDLMAQGLPSNYYVEWEHEQVWHEPQYSWVHHDEEGHWEDHGSYQDKGGYQTVHHEAQYTWVHHEEEGHWE